MKVLTYSRVSTSHHDQNPQVQVEELRRYCKARDWEIAHELVDHGYTGSTEKRPGLKKLYTLVRSRQVDCVVVLKLDRLFRSLKHVVLSLEEFQMLGVQFVAIKDQIDYTTPSGRLFAQLLASMAEFEKSLLRERTLMGLEHAKRHGKILGRPKQRDDEKILSLRGQGLSMRSIASQLRINRGMVERSLAVTKSSQISC